MKAILLAFLFVGCATHPVLIYNQPGNPTIYDPPIITRDTLNYKGEHIIRP